MKLFHLSWLLGMLSYVVFGVFRRSGLSSVETSLGTQGLAVLLVLILPVMLLLLILPVIGMVLGVMSLKRKEGKAWWAIGTLVLNIAMLLTGIILLFPG